VVPRRQGHAGQCRRRGVLERPTGPLRYAANQPSGRSAATALASTRTARRSFPFGCTRPRIGHYHHIVGIYLTCYAQDSAWREDYPRADNDCVRPILGNAPLLSPNRRRASLRPIWARRRRRVRRRLVACVDALALAVTQPLIASIGRARPPCGRRSWTSEPRGAPRPRIRFGRGG